MNNWNSWEDEGLESQLASWTPRRPSLRLRTTLFGTLRTEPTPEAQKLWAGWRWLAPALVCSFMAVMALSPHHDRLARLAGTNAYFSDMTHSPKYAAYLTSAFHSEQNGPLRETLEWTFAPPSNSTLGSWLAVPTNHLLH